MSPAPATTRANPQGERSLAAQRRTLLPRRYGQRLEAARRWK